MTERHRELARSMEAGYPAPEDFAERGGGYEVDRQNEVRRALSLLTDEELDLLWWGVAEYGRLESLTEQQLRLRDMLSDERESLR